MVVIYRYTFTLFQLSGNMQRLMHVSSEIQNDMVCLEKIGQFSNRKTEVLVFVRHYLLHDRLRSPDILVTLCEPFLITMGPGHEFVYSFLCNLFNNLLNRWNISPSDFQLLLGQAIRHPFLHAQILWVSYLSISCCLNPLTGFAKSVQIHFCSIESLCSPDAENHLCVRWVACDIQSSA